MRQYQSTLASFIKADRSSGAVPEHTRLLYQPSVEALKDPALPSPGKGTQAADALADILLAELIRTRRERRRGVGEGGDIARCPESPGNRPHQKAGT